MKKREENRDQKVDNKQWIDCMVYVPQSWHDVFSILRWNDVFLNSAWIFLQSGFLFVVNIYKIEKQYLIKFNSIVNFDLVFKDLLWPGV